LSPSPAFPLFCKGAAAVVAWSSWSFQVQAMAKVATSMQLFGGICTYERVLKEMIGWSDQALHTFSG